MRIFYSGAVRAFLMALLLVGAAFCAPSAAMDDARLSLSQQERLFVTSTPVVYAAARPDNSPFLSFVGGEAVGILPDLAAILSHKIGIRIKVIEVTTPAAYMQLIASRAPDIVLDADGSAEWVERLGYKRMKPYITVPYAKLSLKGIYDFASVAEPRMPNDAAQYAKQYFYPEQTIYCDTAEACVKALLAGKCTATVLNSYMAARAVQTDEEERLDIVPLGGGSRLSFAVNGSRAGTLAPLLARAFASLDEGTIGDIISRYTTYPQPRMTLRRYLHRRPETALFAAVLFFMVLFLLWHLRHEHVMRSLEAQKLADEKVRNELQYAAEHDDLTGMLNKRGFERLARELLDKSGAAGYAIVRWDLDRFKIFNDIFGVREGDRLLASVGDACRREFLADEVCGHLVADHFVACLPASRLDPQDLFARSCRLYQSDKAGYEFIPRVGVYKIDEPQTEISLMCDRAFMALQSIKGSYDRRVAFYDDAMRGRMIAEQNLAGELHEAFEKDQFEVYLQPQLDILSGRIVGAEALTRWIHPQKGVVAPSEFIWYLEEHGLIFKLDSIIWEKTCRLLRKWSDEKDSTLPVSVNISRVDAFNPALYNTICGFVDKYGLNPSLLRLEITESAYIDDTNMVIGVAEKLRAKGFFIELDDFGSGYSSLNMLKDVPVDMIKMDMKFLASKGTEGRSGIILSSIVRMARWLRLPVIAEGVETAGQMAYLKSIGCFLIQGYYFAKPMSVGDFEALTAKEKSGGGYYSAVMDSYFDEKELWNPEGQNTLVFNSLVGPAGIFEFYDDRVEVLRLNDKFFQLLHMPQASFDLMRSGVLESICPPDRAAFSAMLDQARDSRSDFESDTRWLRFDDHTILHLRARARRIARNNESCLIYIAFEEIA